MTRGVSDMYDHIDDWKGDRKPPFPSAIWEFIQAAGQCGKAD